MGRVFGNLTKAKQITTFGLSPYEQKAFVGAISKGVPNTARRIFGVKHFLPWFLITYYIFDKGNHVNHELALKNPADYVNDE